MEVIISNAALADLLDIIDKAVAQRDDEITALKAQVKSLKRSNASLKSTNTRYRNKIGALKQEDINSDNSNAGKESWREQAIKYMKERDEYKRLWLSEKRKRRKIWSVTNS